MVVKYLLLVLISLSVLLEDITDVEAVGERRRCIDIDLLPRSKARDNIILRLCECIFFLQYNIVMSLDLYRCYRILDLLQIMLCPNQLMGRLLY